MSAFARETGTVGMGAMVSRRPVSVLRTVLWMPTIVLMPMLALRAHAVVLVLRAVVEGLDRGFVMHFAVTKLTQDHLC